MLGLMRETVGPEMGVKAAGGARSYADALAFVEAGRPVLERQLGSHFKRRIG